MAHDVGCAGGRSNLKGMTNNPLPDIGFTLQQKEYLQGYFAGLACGGMMPFVGQMPDGRITNMPAPGIANRVAEPESPAEKTAYGTPVSDLCEQELWKLEQHGLDIWDKLIAHANEDKFPDKADTFRFRYRGIFYVAPAQNSFMLRCRVPAGELTWVQLQGLADMAEEWGGGYADINNSREHPDQRNSAAAHRQMPAQASGDRSNVARLGSGQRAQHHRNADGGYRQG
jgi:Nitrite/Sulfite reductase ferredoxin-like half domain